MEWKHIEKLLKKKYKKTFSADGRPAYPPLAIFKLLLLQRWYQLSDPRLRKRSMTRSLLSASAVSRLPVLCRTTLKSADLGLLKVGLYEELFGEIIRRLSLKDLLVREFHGAIVDATIIESPRRLRKVMDSTPKRP